MICFLKIYRSKAKNDGIACGSLVLPYLSGLCRVTVTYGRVPRFERSLPSDMAESV